MTVSETCSCGAKLEAGCAADSTETMDMVKLVEGFREAHWSCRNPNTVTGSEPSFDPSIFGDRPS